MDRQRRGPAGGSVETLETRQNRVLISREDHYRKSASSEDLSLDFSMAPSSKVCLVCSSVCGHMAEHEPTSVDMEDQRSLGSRILLANHWPIGPLFARGVWQLGIRPA